MPFVTILPVKGNYVASSWCRRRLLMAFKSFFFLIHTTYIAAMRIHQSISAFMMNSITFNAQIKNREKTTST